MTQGNHMNYKAGFIAVVLLLPYQHTHAQQQYTGPYAALLKKIELSNPAGSMSYDYSLQLKNMKTAKIEDQVNGRLYYEKDRFVDSNQVFTINKGSQYYCKLNHERKTAEVYNILLLKKKLGRKVNDEQPGTYMQIPFEEIGKNGSILVDSLSDKKKYIISISMKQQMLTHMRLLVNKSDYKLASGTFELLDRDFYSSADEDYRKIYHISNVRYTINPASFDQSRLFKVDGAKVTIARPYAQYTVNSLVK